MGYAVIDKEWLLFTCARCGQENTVSASILRKDREVHETCRDCRAVPVQTIKNGIYKCNPWHGEVDVDTFAPLDEDGHEFMPGERICGKKDCVNRAHVTPPRYSEDELAAALFGIDYLTGTAYGLPK